MLLGHIGPCLLGEETGFCCQNLTHGAVAVKFIGEAEYAGKNISGMQALNIVLPWYMAM